MCVGPKREEREVTRHPSSSPFPPQVSNLPKEATSFDLFHPETLTHFGSPPPLIAKKLQKMYLVGQNCKADCVFFDKCPDSCKRRKAAIELLFRLCFVGKHNSALPLPPYTAEVQQCGV